MGPLDNLPQDPGSQDPRELQHLLMSMTREIRDIQHTLLVQLNQDVTRLHAEKDRLRQDISELQHQEKQLQTRQIQGFNRQQLAQQQLWSKQLAQVLASNLQDELSQRFKEFAPPAERPSIRGAGQSPSLSQGAASSQSDSAYRLMASLDNTLNTTFKTLQQELSSYQSSISQQLNRMHSLQQQGEVILETLVERLISQLQEDAGGLSSDVGKLLGDRFTGQPAPQPTPQTAAPTSYRPEPTQQMGVVERPAPQPAAAPAPAPAPTPAQTQEQKNFVTGIVLILISSLIISIQNIVTRVILSVQPVLFLGEMGGIIGPSAGNSLLILAMRMIFVVPGMLIVGSILYPNTLRDIRQLGNPEKRGSVWIVILSGVSLFLSQFFIYFALGNVATGVAISIFFVFPTVTVLLAWLIFGSRPSFILGLATITIYIGCFLTVPAAAFQSRAGSNIWLGAGTALLSGVTFAGYVILTQLSAKKLKLHPAPYSVINFFVILVLATGALGFFPANVPEGNQTALWGGALILAVTTLTGYALNNFGIPMIGAAFASVVSASGPALTSLLAVGVISESLALNQWLGVGLVTLWVIGISVDNMSRQKQAAKK
jgi:drug/metabolite transporter (DMT)-like permease